MAESGVGAAGGAGVGPAGGVGVGAGVDPGAAGGRLRRPDGAFTLLGLHLLLAVTSVVVCAGVWLLAGRGFFWPAWVVVGFGFCLGLQVVVQGALTVPTPSDRLFVAHLGLSAVCSALVVAVWALADPGDPWPVWAVGGIVVVLLLHLVARNQLRPAPSEQLRTRVDELTRSRRGTLDAQAAQLRRIERDLHDGAQARLVALTMQLGRAEQRLGPDADPDTLALVRAAQEEARLAIGELRDLARGISPPLLADRGLAAAVDALGRRSPLEVRVEDELGHRPPPLVETAAYFVVAEALTNATKHSGAEVVVVRLTSDRRRLRVVVEDDGRGGADASGNGLSGLAQRAEALDGTLEVVSHPGHGTSVIAELPCE